MNLFKTTLITLSFMSLVGCGGSNAEVTEDSSGEEVYLASCATCHSGGFKGWMTDAPEIGDKAAWKPLIGKGIEGLTLASVNGIGKMPQKGGCKTCSNAQIKAAVEYMVSKSQ